MERLFVVAKYVGIVWLFCFCLSTLIWMGTQFVVGTLIPLDLANQDIRFAIMIPAAALAFVAFVLEIEHGALSFGTIFHVLMAAIVGASSMAVAGYAAGTLPHTFF